MSSWCNRYLTTDEAHDEWFNTGNIKHSVTTSLCTESPVFCFIGLSIYLELPAETCTSLMSIERGGSQILLVSMII